MTTTRTIADRINDLRDQLADLGRQGVEVPGITKASGRGMVTVWTSPIKSQPMTIAAAEAMVAGLGK